MKKIIYLALLACVSTAVLSAPSSVSTSRAQPTQKSPAQVAVQNHKSGSKALAKVYKYEKKLATAKSDKGRAKIQKKIDKTLATAAKKFKTAVKNDPSLYEAHSDLGYTLRRLGKYDAALASYDRALDLNPSYSPAIEYRGEAYLSLGRLDDAKKAYRSLLNSDRSMAEKLLRVMEDWVENPANRPTSVDDAKVSEFSGWVREQKATAKQTAGL